MPLEYGVTLEVEDDGVTLTMPDIPGVVTFGDTEEEALKNGVGAFAALVSELISQRRDVPQPGPVKRGQERIALPSLIAQKVLLYQAMREEGVTAAELARRLNKMPNHVQRLLDVLHSSRHDQLDEAMQALGKRYKVEAGPALRAG
jgi:antitoxin HicB